MSEATTFCVLCTEAVSVVRGDDVLCLLIRYVPAHGDLCVLSEATTFCVC